jgi:hypothetical protein
MGPGSDEVGGEAVYIIEKSGVYDAIFATPEDAGVPVSSPLHLAADVEHGGAWSRTISDQRRDVDLLYVIFPIQF